MKRILPLVLVLFLTKSTLAQLPFTYQFKLHRWNSNDSLEVKVQLLNSMQATLPLYEEYHRLLASPLNIAILDVGGGVPLRGKYDSINWAEGEKYIRIYYKPLTSAEYTLHLTEQLVSVPYAMYALRSGTPPIQGDKGEPGDSGVVISDIKLLDDTLNIILSDNRVFKFGGMRGAKGRDGKIPVSFTHQNDSLYVLFNDSSIVNAGRSRGDTGEAGKPAPLGGYDLYIGQYYQGGIIFHLWHENDTVHGLIVSLTDLCSSCKWMDKDTNAIVDSANTVDGRKNTAYILAQTWINQSAAKVCDTFSFAGYDDWYLPSLEEWRLLLLNMIPVNRALSRITGTHSLTRPFKCYWTSNFESIMTASYVEPNTIDRARVFYGGVIYTNSLLYVRAIRRF